MRVSLCQFVDKADMQSFDERSTTLSVWVHPTTPRESTRVALFVESGEGEGEGVAGLRVETLDVYQLASPPQ